MKNKITYNNELITDIIWWGIIIYCWAIAFHVGTVMF
jgi:hypothetical protein